MLMQSGHASALKTPVDSWFGAIRNGSHADWVSVACCSSSVHPRSADCAPSSSNNGSLGWLLNESAQLYQIPQPSALQADVWSATWRVLWYTSERGTVRISVFPTAVKWTARHLPTLHQAR